MTTTTKTSDRVIVTCQDCGADRDVHRKTYRDIRNGIRSARCQPCGNRARAAAPPPDAFGDWRTQAACRGMAGDAFYPPLGTRGAKLWELEAEAKAVCAVCPVTASCRDAGRAERYGVWGGLTPAERGFNGRGQSKGRAA